MGGERGEDERAKRWRNGRGSRAAHFDFPPLLRPAAQASSREEFENAALFLRIGLPSTLIRHENGTFRNGSSTWRNMKSPIFRFRVFDGKRFENGAR